MIKKGSGLKSKKTDEQVVTDYVNKPPHYTRGISTFKYIESWGMNFAQGNVIKYLTRAPHKMNEYDDLKKARWYLNQLIKKAAGKPIRNPQ